MHPDSDLPQDSPDLTGKPLEIGTARDGDSVIITAAGELDISTAAALETVLRDAEETEIGGILLDLSDLSFLDSTGLRVLLQARSRSDGRLRFVPSKHDAVARLLALTGTDDALS